MPSTVYLERELQKPAEAHSFKNIEVIRSYLVEQKADEIIKKWHHIKRQLTYRVFAKAEEW